MKSQCNDFCKAVALPRNACTPLVGAAKVAPDDSVEFSLPIIDLLGVSTAIFTEDLIDGPTSSPTGAPSKILISGQDLS